MTDHDAIQAKIDKTRKLCDAATFQGNNTGVPEFRRRCRVMREFEKHARKMLPRYARALKQALYRLEDPNMSGALWIDVQCEILSILNGESEGSDGNDRR